MNIKLNAFFMKLAILSVLTMFTSIAASSCDDAASSCDEDSTLYDPISATSESTISQEIAKNNAIENLIEKAKEKCRYKKPEGKCSSCRISGSIYEFKAGKIRCDGPSFCELKVKIQPATTCTKPAHTYTCTASTSWIECYWVRRCRSH